MKNSKSKIADGIVSILAVLLICALIGSVYFFTNGFNEDLKTFYIEHNGKKIVTEETKLYFDLNSKQRFDVKYLSGTVDSDKYYSVSIVPNTQRECKFSFAVNGSPKNYDENNEAIKDLTDYFDIEEKLNYFVLSIDKDFSMNTLLSKLYDNQEVIINDSLPIYEYYFIMKITSYNEKITYNIYFNIYTSSEYVQQITDLTNDVNRLTSENSTLKKQVGNLETTNAQLEEDKIDLQEDLEVATNNWKHYEALANSLQTGEFVIATFENNGQVWQTIKLPKDTSMFDFVLPNTDTLEFLGWAVDGEIVEMSTYKITENTTFVAQYEEVKIITVNCEYNVVSSGGGISPFWGTIENPEYVKFFPATVKLSKLSNTVTFVYGIADGYEYANYTITSGNVLVTFPEDGVITLTLLTDFIPPQDETVTLTINIKTADSSSGDF